MSLGELYTKFKGERGKVGGIPGQLAHLGTHAQARLIIALPLGLSEYVLLSGFGTSHPIEFAKWERIKLANNLHTTKSKVLL